MRIESALVVKRVKTKAEFNGDIWLGFERLTCVPIQTRMVKETMLSKEEKQWLKVQSRLAIFARFADTNTGSQPTMPRPPGAIPQR